LPPRLFAAESVRLRESAAVIETLPSRCRRIRSDAQSMVLVKETHSGRTTPATRLLGAVARRSSDRLPSFTCVEEIPRFTQVIRLRGAVALARPGAVVATPALLGCALGTRKACRAEMKLNSGRNGKSNERKGTFRSKTALR
jgi:hypothetical protein